ncbi:MAG: hypothetical protein JKY65_16225 [Planctomycetes bacterium]|nr:hypothetical protein [Planctomycetota bacterium]
MNDPELLRQRRAAGADPSDPRPLYRYRVMVLKAGAPIRSVPGDQVALDDEDDEGRVIRVREVSGGPQEICVRIGERIVKVQHDVLKIVGPHRPAVLLGEDELAKRLEEDAVDPHDPRALETLGEVARRRLKAGIPVAVDLMAQVADRPQDTELRRVLTQICRGRPFGEVEVELLHRKLTPEERDLVELPALAAVAPDADVARELLDRLEAMDHDQARQVVLSCGRNLVGAGGPGFVDAELRERVAVMSREHPDHGVRVGLFMHAVPVLQSEEILIEKALPSSKPEVRGKALAELMRRGKREIVLTHSSTEEDPLTLRSSIAVLSAPLPQELIERCLNAGRADAELEEATLLRLPELGAAAAAPSLAPWLREGRTTNLEAAIWAAGHLSKETVGDDLVKLLGKLERLDRIGLVVEALARLGHDLAAAALDAWGVALLEAGCWGEEIVDVCGLLIGRRVDGRELLGRFLVDPPQHPIRAARALEVARWLLSRDEGEQARPAKAWLPSENPRYRTVQEALG